jgi:very-short-patch-repair endonuclease
VGVSSGMNTIAKILRKRLTDTEKVLWRHLRAKQVEGHKFRRQEPIGKHIVDFVCHEKRIVIELDGGQHSIDKEEILKETNGLRDRDIRFYDSGIMKF